MKYSAKKTLSVFLLFILPAAGILSGCRAEPDEPESHGRPMIREIVTLPAGTVVNRDYFAAADSVEISGTVNGDVYAAGGQILVDGTINGDLLAAGGRVIISGRVSQDARVAGGQITINGEIQRNVTLAGGNIEITDSAVIGGGAVAAGGNIHLGAPVSGDVKAAAGNLTVSNRIDGNLHAAAGTIRLTSRAALKGNLTYWSQDPARIDEKAAVSGVISRREIPEHFRQPRREHLGILLGLGLLAKLISFGSTLVLGLLLIHFYPRGSEALADQLRERPLACLGLGFLALVLTPILIGLLGITVIGIPLAVLSLALFLIVLYVARIFVLLRVGLILFERWGRPDYLKWAFFSGLVIYTILTLIPFLGGLVTLLVLLFGLGMVLLTKKKMYSTVRF